ncbi:mannonate dehydratase [Sphingomonas sp.]|uniref:mannonate dehydratase n=1 Tax=Sphingomonas sp. TaxID=28214 RepID=UPI0031D27071
MRWFVVEGLRLHENVETCGAAWDRLIAACARSLLNLAGCGTRTVTYDFMPMLDRTRTDLARSLHDGARTLRFNKLAAVVAFDLQIFKRLGAELNYDAGIVEAATKRFCMMDISPRLALERTILARLPRYRAARGTVMQRCFRR